MPYTPPGGSGVTSVGLTLPNVFAVTGSPVTGAGTLAGTLVVQAANAIWAGPTTGAAAAPTFRALVAADIPDLSATYQPLNAKLTAIAALANAAGWLHNDGSGVFAYSTPSVDASALTGTTLASGVVTSSLTTVGIIGTGTWHGTAITDTYISSAATWNAKQAAITTGTTAQYLKGDLSLGTLNQAAVAGLTTSDSPSFANTTLTGGSLTLNDWVIDRSSATLLQIKSPNGSNPSIRFYNGASALGYMQFSGSGTSNQFGTTASGASMVIWSGAGIAAATFDSSQNTTLAGSLTTAAPSGGTAAAWKAGINVTSGTSVLDATGYVQLDVGGTLVKLARVTNS